MAQPAWAKTVAQQAMREGTSATQALRLFREAGGQVRTQTWYRLYGQAQLEGAMASKEFSAQLRRIPTASEIQTATAPRARGYMQRVTVYGRDENGNVITRDVSLRGDRLVSRENAVAKAMALVQAGMEDPEKRDRYPLAALLMGAYQGTFEFAPEEG
jgi:hypothetical protein